MVTKLFTTLLVYCVTLSAFAGPTQKPIARVSFGGYYYDSVTRNAYSLGVATKSFSPVQGSFIFNKLNINGKADTISLPTTVLERWNELTYTAQILTYIKTANPHFFGGGI